VAETKVDPRVETKAGAEVPWLSEPEMRAWRALISTTTGLLATLDNELQASHGLTLGDYEVLVVLSEVPEHSLRMSDLAARLHLSPSGITRRIDGLVRSGLVRRQTCPTDRRGSNAVLTDRGVKTLERAAPTHLRGVREYFIDRLSERQLANLAAALSTIEIDATAAAGGCDNAR
jgi:DNA-binding MarR family transcriptional regulator